MEELEDRVPYLYASRLKSAEALYDLPDGCPLA